MGRFKRWSLMLAKATSHPVFVQMRQTQVPVLVDPRVFYPWAEAQPKPLSYKLMGLFRAFTMSERYSRAIMSEGAHYHDLEGVVTRTVTEISIESARRNIETIEQRRRDRGLVVSAPSQEAREQPSDLHSRPVGVTRCG